MTADLTEAAVRADVRKYVEEAVAALPGATAHEIATKAAESVPAKQLRSCLAEALTDTVRLHIGQSRRDAFDGALNGSAKKRDIASWWQRMLGERVNVNGRLIPLGDCTFDDLQACIDDRERLITRVSGQIDNFKRLQKLLLDHGVKTVSAVPAQKEWKK